MAKMSVALVFLLALFGVGFAAAVGSIGEPSIGTQTFTNVVTYTIPTETETAIETVTVKVPETQAKSYGVNEPLLSWGSPTTPAQKQAMLDDQKALGSTVTRFLPYWSVVEASRGTYRWAGVDADVARIRNSGLNVLMLLGTTPEWARVVSSSNAFTAPKVEFADEFGEWARRLVERYATPPYNVRLFEVWNEPNHAPFWRGEPPNPEHYTVFLNAAYRAMKAQAARMGVEITVMSGGLALGPSDGFIHPVDFLRRMYQAGARMDAVAHHPYTGDQNSTTAPGWRLMFENVSGKTDSLRSLMKKNGDAGKPIYATETGYSHTVWPKLTEEQIVRNVAIDIANWEGYPWAAGFLYHSGRPYGDGDFGLSDASFPPNHRPRWNAYRDAIKQAG
jgi:hypothetical protein